MAGSDVAGLVIGLGANTASLQGDMNNAANIVARSVSDINVTIGKIGSGANFSGVSSQVRGITSDFEKLQSVVGAVFSAGLGIGGLKEIESLADDYQNVSNRIRTTVADSQQLADVQAKVFAIAQDTARGLDETAKTYQRIEQAIQSSGASQVEAQSKALAITKTLNEEIVVSGANASEASHAITDLVHGLAGGEIQARQFNQVMRQMPDLAKQIADGMGVSTQQLEKMVHAGLPAKALLDALANQAGVIDDKFNALPKTFAQTWTILSNAVEQYIGKAAQGSTVTVALKEGIVAAAQNIGPLVQGAEAVAAAMALWLGGKGLTGLGNITLALKDAALAQGAYKSVAILSAEGDIATAAATKAAMAATIARTDAENDLRVAQLATIQSSQSALISEQALLETRLRELPVGINVIADEERLIAVRAELSTSTAKVAVLEDAMAASQAKATLAENAETAATVRLAESQVALSAAQVEATSAAGLLSRGGGALFALMGGWTTVVIAVAAGLYFLATAENSVEEESDRLAKITDEVTKAHANLSPQLEKTAEAAYAAAQATLATATANEKFAETNFAAVAAQGGEAAMQMGQDMGRAQQDVSRLTDNLNNLAGAILRAKLSAAGKSIYEALFPDIRAALAQVDALTDGIDKQAAGFAQQAATYGKGHAALVQYQKDQEFARITLGLSADAVVKVKAALDEKYDADLRGARALDAVTASTKANNKEMSEQEAASKRYVTDMSKVADLQAQLSSNLGGPWLVALKKYQEGIDLTAQTWADAVVKFGGVNKVPDDVVAQLTKEQEDLREQLHRTTAELNAQHDVVGQYFEKLRLDTTLVGLTDKEKDQAQAIADLTEKWNKYTPEIQNALIVAGKIDPTTEAGTRAIRDQVGVLYDQKQAFALNAEAAKGWQSIWSTAGNSVADTFAKVLVEGGSLLGGLKDLAKQTVEQIIAYFARLAVINPILNSVFGGQAGFSLLPMLTNFTGGGSGFGGAAINAAVSNGGASQVLSAGGTAGTGFSLTSPSTWLSAGQNLFSGFSSGFSTLWNGTPGATGSSFLGGPSYYSDANGFMQGTPYSPSLAGNALGIAGGLYAGYSRYQSAGGGFAGLAGGAAYGLGTLTAAGAIGGVLSGAGAAAGAAGGLGAVGLGAIPVVGWVALAAMVIDKISGGKLFGTSYQTKGSTTSLNLGADGGDATAFLLQTKQGALFSGTKTRQKATDAGAEAQKAAQELFDAVEKTMVTAAAKIKTDVPPMIAAALDVVNTYDKKGNVTATKYDVNIGGKKYDEDTQEAAVQRIQAEAILATVGASKIGAAASAIAEQWRSSADTLMDGANFLLAATADITKGVNLLGDGGSLTDIAAVVTALQQGTETLVDTYTRLGQETKLIQDAFDLAGVSVGKTGVDLVKFADSAATAAGGVDALSQIIQTFDQAFFSPQELAAHQTSTLKKASDDALSQIGENPLESMATFKADFLAALPTLTPDQLAAWYAAGAALATYTGAVNDSANSILAAKQKYGQFELQLYGDDFLNSFTSVIAAEQQQIDTANQLAIAAGLAGASQEDLARITAQGSLQVGQALAKLTQGIQQDVQALLGPQNIAGFDDTNVVANNKAAIDAQNAASQANRTGAAYDVIQKLGDVAFASGKSVADVLKQEGISADAIAAALGTSADDVMKQIDAAEKEAGYLANLNAQGDVQTGLLSNILAAIQGNPLPYNVSSLGAPPTVALDSSGKIGGPNKVAGPISGREMAQAVGDGTKTGQSDLVSAIRDLLFELRGGRGGGSTNRNTAGNRQFVIGAN